MVNLLIAFFVGFLLGWLTEWVIDWLYWRNQKAGIQAQLERSLAENRRLKAEVAENKDLRQKLTTAEREIEWLKEKLAAQPEVAPRGVERVVIIQNNLEDINGIGPVFSKRLNDANIHTFAELAALNVGTIKDIVYIDGESWQSSDIEAWINQARQLTRISQNHA